MLSDVIRKEKRLNLYWLLWLIYEVVDVKVAVASDDGVKIAKHFGKSMGFKIFEIKENKILSDEYRQNIGKNTGECGSCNHSVIIKNLSDCSIVISYGMGFNIYNDLLDNNIRAIVTDVETVDDAINKFISSGLENRTDKLH